MRLMNQFFRLYIAKFMVVYFDDILIYSKDERGHQDHLTQVMLVLEHERLFGNLKKCAFFTPEVTFLGYIVTGEGINANECKIQVIQSRPTTMSIHDA